MGNDKINNRILELETENKLLKQQIKNLSWQKLEIGICEPEIGEICECCSIEDKALLSELKYVGNGEFQGDYENYYYCSLTHWKPTNIPE